MRRLSFKTAVLTVFAGALCGALGYFVMGQWLWAEEVSVSVHEAGFDAEPTADTLTSLRIGKGQNYTIAELNTYTRVPGPLRVGLQIGHWQNEVMPEELASLEQNTGAVWRGLRERDVMYEIVTMTAALLEADGMVVDILPATVPKGYKADAFISVHADGNQNTAINGYKIAAPRIDYSGRAANLVAALYDTYGAATGLREDTAITNRMTAYYAFNWPRYEHAIHPHTPAAIVETGFLTSATDRAVIVDTPAVAAAGIAEGIKAFLADTTTDYQVRQIVVPTLPLVGEVVCAPLRAERRNSTRTYDCLPSIQSSDGYQVALFGVASTSPLLGTTVTATGEYMPAQMLDTYFWFPYDVVGMVVDQQLMSGSE